MEKVGLSAILEGLCQAKIEFILVGGLASVVQGAPITTMDVDIVPRRRPGNLERLFLFLKSVEAYQRRMDEILIKPTKEQISGNGHILLTTRFGPLDVLGTIEEARSYEDLLEHTVEVPFRGYILRVLRLDFLIELKKTSEDPREKLRLQILKEALRQLKNESTTSTKANKEGF
jgi:hypothetical protein